MRIAITTFVMALIGGISWAQIDTTTTLVSKVDFQDQYELHDGNLIKLMGYTQTLSAAIDLPSPTLRFTEGDSVQLNLWNLSQGAPHSIHLHGLDVDQQNDGVPMLSFDVPHDQTGSYFFKAPHPGTYIYHCHVTSVVHVQGGMYGLVIIDPQSADTVTWDGGHSFHSEQAWMVSEVDTNWHHDTIVNHTHDTTMNMTHPILPYEPQHFLINGKSEQQLVANGIELIAGKNEIVYLRLANIGYYGNRFIFPAELNARAVSSDGRPLPTTYISDTIELLPGERYGVLVESSVDLMDVIDVEFFDLNTGGLKNTQQINVDIHGMVGLDELSTTEPIVYPNPASKELYVKVPNGIDAEVEIRNMLGQTVLDQQKATAPVNLSALKSGTYFVRITSNSAQWIKTITVK